ncbi:family 10 glycosylhydrolase [Rapidithrix thailandica]|uniref:Family 10 glycosylhydrolase n=1 Tax=Rapidithrix thailandica TaxID=413964 RepID=A0AAW9SCK4_9BACT
MRNYSLLLFFLIGFVPLLSAQSKYPKHEFRAAWIASVVNIDWPSKKGLSTEDQKEEFIRMADFLQASGMNALVVQVRPVADAFYESSYEPWSAYLTGKQGQAPEPYYDPLQFMIEESRKRGLEFHAWFNPYRATMNADTTVLDSMHALKQHPEWFVKYGKRFYFDPGNPEVRSFVQNVIMEVVHNYDVDGIHFDDYFYPYPVKDEVFDDSLSYEKYGSEYEVVGDWRRANVDQLIKSVYDSIQAVKPYVKFGISPFGVWRNQSLDPEGSETKAGVNTYDDLYADVRKWLQEGWVDYVVPQLYWTIGFPPAAYDKLADWWSQNTYGRHLYIGQAMYRVKNGKDRNWHKLNQLHKQLQLNHEYPSIQGSIYFSAKSFKKVPEKVLKKIKKKHYRHNALTPPMPWKKQGDLEVPVLLEARKQEDKVRLRWEAVPGQTSSFVIYRFQGDQAGDLSDPQNILTVLSAEQLAKGEYMDQAVKKGKTYTYCITSIDRANNESKPVTLTLKGKQDAWQNELTRKD